MARKLAEGDRVDILAGDERGGWGIVKLYCSPEEIYVSLYGPGGETRLYERSELRRPRNQNPQGVRAGKPEERS